MRTKFRTLIASLVAVPYMMIWPACFVLRGAIIISAPKQHQKKLMQANYWARDAFWRSTGDWHPDPRPELGLAVTACLSAGVDPWRLMLLAGFYLGRQLVAA